MLEAKRNGSLSSVHAFRDTSPRDSIGADPSMTRYPITATSVLPGVGLSTSSVSIAPQPADHWLRTEMAIVRYRPLLRVQ